MMTLGGIPFRYVTPKAERNISKFIVVFGDELFQTSAQIERGPAVDVGKLGNLRGVVVADAVFFRHEGAHGETQLKKKRLQ